ncbi:MAG TPA: class I SAM-dependent methyltransferase [Candidatus Dormibacteraeota bacterium]|nr:class I SAM-dependent methyltransferase [Candidatus Dormibacteraeota bacterium]
MRRFDISEIHESPWFPQSLRNLVTDGLQFILNTGRVYRPVAGRLHRALEAAGAKRVIDLCSGGAGPWPWLHSVLYADGSDPVKIVLTDKFPNLAAFKNAHRKSCGAIVYSLKPVDASRIPARLCGFRTVFTSFHHFSPAEVVAILQDAADHRQGIGVFDAARRRPVTIAANCAVLIAALATAPFMRPFRVSRLFWTYVLPVVPAVLFVDGILSCLRAYSPAELLELCEKISAPGYKWDVGEDPGFFGPVTYLLGYPPQDASSKAERELRPCKIGAVAAQPDLFT